MCVKPENFTACKKKLKKSLPTNVQRGTVVVQFVKKLYPHCTDLYVLWCVQNVSKTDTYMNTDRPC